MRFVSEHPQHPVELVLRVLGIASSTYYSWRTREDAENALFAYIDGWYNAQRIQKKLGCRSPDEYEANYHDRVPAGTR
ncbi:hypothetical protein CJ469_02603 [Nocardia farcinica]|uniref:IS3 family transposase n=1 Tax=Nocardia farcinica TaxID=37329 RepID=UPI000C013260|nr:IS3 family transposase [Nocardia farcinica]PFX02158.1 hypothetical protein CJ469_02603 [Nocardia farcinica]PFX08212.1 hypothetical protein CJ468_02761 [Nocardia farcinica]